MPRTRKRSLGGNKNTPPRLANELLRFKGTDDSILEILENVSGVKKAVAKKILGAYPKGRGLADATINSLMHLGATAKQARSIHNAFKLSVMCGESCQAIAGERMSTPDHVVRFVRSMLGTKHQESFGVVMLNKQLRPIEVLVVNTGGLSEVAVSPNDVFREAIRIGGVSGVILFHNHPSGEHDPSNADISLTETMVKAGKLVGIPVVDHLIVSKDGHRSLRDSGFHF